jgi:hypothetical protein
MSLIPLQRRGPAEIRFIEATTGRITSVYAALHRMGAI